LPQLLVQCRTLARDLSEFDGSEPSTYCRRRRKESSCNPPRFFCVAIFLSKSRFQFSLRISDLFRISDFEFRISFAPRGLSPRNPLSRSAHSALEFVSNSDFGFPPTAPSAATDNTAPCSS
jgi:hypothetical protein